MAIFVVLATVAGIVIVAITTSGNENLEASGKTDLDAACAPNEVRNQDLESRGIKGNHPTIAGLTSNNIGCLPHCATWEYPSKGPNKEGEYEYDPSATSLTDTIGGTDGADGVYSTNTGCFAPCYWQHRFIDANGDHTSQGHPWPNLAAMVDPADNKISTLHFDTTNRHPGRNEIRFGVVYSQTDQPSDFANSGNTVLDSSRGRGWLPNGTDPIIQMAPRGGGGVGRRNSVEGIAPIGAYTHKPALAQRPGHFEMEVRADPDNETCTIYDAANDMIVCSSEDESCTSRGYSA